jgi:hypothetical protein
MDVCPYFGWTPGELCNDGMRDQFLNGNKKMLLFRIICGVCKYSRIEPSKYFVMAFNHYAMLKRMNELCIEDDFELFVYEFPATVGVERSSWTLAFGMKACKVLEFI